MLLESSRCCLTCSLSIPVAVQQQEPISIWRTIMGSDDPRKFVPSVQELSPLFASPGDDMHQHIARVHSYVQQRDGLCIVQGCAGKNPAGAARHENIRRGNVWRASDPRQVVIFAPTNCCILCGDHHNTDKEPSKEQLADIFYTMYGIDYLRWLMYLDSMLRTRHPLMGWLEAHAQLLY